MLLQFRCGNYRSIKDDIIFHMTTASIKEHENTHTFEVHGNRLLKSAVIYGSNASGKSNVIKALNFMRSFVLTSQSPKEFDSGIDVEGFLLSNESDNEPSFFEVVFQHKNIRYRYGFEVTRESVYKEWLYYVPAKKETYLFEREGSNIRLNKGNFKEGRPLQENMKLIREDALFLSAVANWGGDISREISTWFKNINIQLGYIEVSHRKLADTLSANQKRKDLILEFLKVADLGIEDIKSDFKEITSDILKGLPETLQQIMLTSENKQAYRVTTFHKRYDNLNNFVGLQEFSMENHESEGTKKFASLLNPILDVLENGGIWVVDELDSRLHPLLTEFIVSLFHSSETNPQNAQLIFATHDTNLLDKRIFRRDQIWFAEKDRFGCTSLFSLVDYKNVRNDSSYEKDYIRGKYGAIPLIKINRLFGLMGEKDHYDENERRIQEENKKY